MNDKTKRILGIAGAAVIALGAGGMAMSGASMDQASGIVGLAFLGVGAIMELIRGILKK